MSRSTFIYKNYRLIGNTRTVMTACGILAKIIRENDPHFKLSSSPFTNKLLENSNTFLGVVYINLSDFVNDNNLNSFLRAIETTIKYIKSFGDEIPLSIIKKLQDEGYLEHGISYATGTPTIYLLDFLEQTKNLLVNPNISVGKYDIYHSYIFKDG